MLISLKSAIKIQYDFAEIDDPVDPDKTGYGVVICVFEPNNNKMARDQLFVLINPYGDAQEPGVALFTGGSAVIARSMAEDRLSAN
ncbi:hypothetical protein RB195_001304 [Necator americanus]|uniref:Uncharacterized protein n=1 Tax=Necator americanus TaxID=51031 RepID=A0ABR1DE26_NECAM